MMPFDSFRSRVYRWERQVVHAFLPTKLSFAQCREMVWAVYQALGIPEEAPVVTQGTAKTKAWYRMPTLKEPKGRIQLSPGTQYAWVVYHEVAHALLTRYYRTGEESWHGGTFVTVYIELLRRFGGLHAGVITLSARKAGIPVQEIDAMKKIVPSLANAPALPLAATAAPAAPKAPKAAKKPVESPVASPAPKPSLTREELQAKLQYHVAKRQRYIKRAAGHSEKAAEIEALLALAPVVVIPPTGK